MKGKQMTFQSFQGIINLTQHAATPDQLAAGVVDLPPERAAEVRKAITFEALPTVEEVRERAERVARIAQEMGARLAMIGGAGFLLSTLESALRKRGIEPLYAFSVRDSAEETLPDGSVRKVQVFRHAGFVRVQDPS